MAGERRGIMAFPGLSPLSPRTLPGLSSRPLFASLIAAISTAASACRDYLDCLDYLDYL